LLFSKNGIWQNGLEGESIGRVKFQPVPASTKHERSSNPADSGKKVLPGVEQFRSRLFSGFADERNDGINFFACVQDLFYEALSPQCVAALLGSVVIKGNVLRGW